jgi:hypothetical protein
MKELTKTVILIAITLALFSSDSGFSYPTPAETGHEPEMVKFFRTQNSRYSLLNFV